MAPMETTVPGALVWGHAALAVCAALYLAWWWVFFNPSMPKATGALYAVGVGFIVGAVAFGIAAIALMAMGLGALAGAPQVGGAAPGWAFAVGGVVAYLALAYLTARFFQRPVTTELLLFVLWAALELAVANALLGAGLVSGGAFWLIVGVIALITAANLVCYVLYFNLPPMPSFIDGAAPLAAVGAFAAVLAVVLARL
ncbi:hypothetical protein [Arabiibacter massiliensis]|uniref:hypothetical protein n=1 Tax=Arabiibacter massiliensis TaxID=1870985 RepID=UPI001E4AA7EC|nr:hypothetical protein [Arabiibacter massiliensis]